MRDFIISTDSVSDLSEDFICDNNIAIHPLTYIMEGVEYCYGRKVLSQKDFYAMMRNGKCPTTSATNPTYIRELMEKQVLEGFDILHISFSSELSSSYNNAKICADEIMEKVEESRIIVIDSVCATASLGLLVSKAIEMKNAGLSIDEIKLWIEKNKEKVINEFVVKDLFHLARGGRLTKTKARFGTTLNIRPILKLDNEGKITISRKERGNKKSLNSLIKDYEKKAVNKEASSIFISHADVREDAEYLANKFRSKYGIEDITINNIGPTIGAHIGADSLVLAYIGQER